MSLIEKLSSKIQFLPDLRIDDGFIYKRVEHTSGDAAQEEMSWKLWVPPSMTDELIKRAHDHPLCAHGGVGKTLHRLKTFFFWPKTGREKANLR